MLLPVLALGGSGGQRIATEVTQAALCRLVFARDPSACVSLPRMHVAMSGELFVERDVPEDVREGLKKRGEPVNAGGGGKWASNSLRHARFKNCADLFRVLPQVLYRENHVSTTFDRVVDAKPPIKQAPFTDGFEVL